MPTLMRVPQLECLLHCNLLLWLAYGQVHTLMRLVRPAEGRHMQQMMCCMSRAASENDTMAQQGQTLCTVLAKARQEHTGLAKACQEHTGLARARQEYTRDPPQ